MRVKFSISLVAYCLLLLHSLLLPAGALATEGGALHSGILRDYATAFGQDKGRLEIAVDYLIMNDTVDLFDLRDDEIDSVNPSLRSEGLGDLRGGSILANYGLAEGTSLHGEASYRDLELSLLDFQVQSYELSLRQALRGRRPLLSLDAGVRLNRAEDEQIREVGAIDTFVRRVDPNLSVKVIGSHLVFSDGNVTLFAPKAGKPPLEVSLEGMQDFTGFLRLTLGKPLGPMAPNLFFEYGRTRIDSELKSNIDQYVSRSLSPQIDEFSRDLGRHESYWKAGFDLYLTTDSGLTANLQFDYIRLSRPGGLETEDANQVLKGDLSYLLTERLAVNLGATYYRRQFNGVIPFLYNKHTQSGFDHQYGVVRAGLVLLLGG